MDVRCMPPLMEGYLSIHYIFIDFYYFCIFKNKNERIFTKFLIKTKEEKIKDVFNKYFPQITKKTI